MPGEWNQCFTNPTLRKRHATGSWESTNEHWSEVLEEEVTAKRLRLARNTSSGQTEQSNGKEESEARPSADCGWHMPFSSQNTPLVTAHAIPSLTVTRMNHESPCDDAAMETDCSFETGVPADSQREKTPECQRPSATSSPEICRQLCLAGGYSPGLINSFMEGRMGNGSINGAQGTGENPVKRERSSAFGCYLFPLHNDFY